MGHYDKKTDPIALSEALQAKAKQQRREAWARIKSEAPDVAEFLTEVSRVFGKPKSVYVEINGEVIMGSKKLNDLL